MASVVLLIPYSPEGIQAFRQYGYRLSGEIRKIPQYLGVLLNAPDYPKNIYVMDHPIGDFRVLIPLNKLHIAMTMASVIPDSTQLRDVLRTLN
jgi:hypothetical protein